MAGELVAILCFTILMVLGMANSIFGSSTQTRVVPMRR